MHTFTGCDTTSKVGTKIWAIKGDNNGYELLYYFARDELREQEITDTEKFFLTWIMNYDVDTCNELLFIVYHEKHMQFVIERFRPTSDSIRQHNESILAVLHMASGSFSGNH